MGLIGLRNHNLGSNLVFLGSEESKAKEEFKKQKLFIIKEQKKAINRRYYQNNTLRESLIKIEKEIIKKEKEIKEAYHDYYKEMKEKELRKLIYRKERTIERINSFKERESKQRERIN